MHRSSDGEGDVSGGRYGRMGDERAFCVKYYAK